MLAAPNLVSAQSTSAPAPQASPASAAALKVGAANLNITPRRAIFEGNKRTEAVYVFNQGNAAVTVDVALVDNIMLASGEIVPVASAPEKGASATEPLARLRSARSLIVATPSRIVLAPGKGKTVRLRAGMPDAAAGPGEYRTHLTVTTLPPPSSGVTVDAAATNRGELAFTINTVFGISIPLIVRSGGVTATAAFGPFGLESAPPQPAGANPATPPAILTVPLRRTGAASVYGNIEVRSGSGKNGELIGLVRGIAVYPEVDQRVARIPLVRLPRRGEALTITFLSDDGKAAGELARGSFIAP
jgi:P pilus assembly chaperone PapD